MDRTQPCIEIIKNKIFANCEFKNIEKTDNEVLLWLDRFSGIDYIVKSKENHIIGVAARIQFGKDWSSFTIRYNRHNGNKTEYEKRKEAIEKGYFYPAYTLQAYFNKEGNSMISACLVSTRDLYHFIDNNPSKVFKNKSDNDFIFVNWSDLKKIKEVFLFK